MFKLPTEKTPILCQGITTEMGAVHVEQALAYGSHIVAGTSRDKSIKRYQDIPIFTSVREAVRRTKPAISVVFSTPIRALQDVEEAIKAKIPMVICTTEHVPLHDILKNDFTGTKKRGYFNRPLKSGYRARKRMFGRQYSCTPFSQGKCGDYRQIQFFNL